jgi:hypothetical protein
MHENCLFQVAKGRVEDNRDQEILQQCTSQKATFVISYFNYYSEKIVLS